MHDLWTSVLLGILQGLTEFLPVSSSGHLELAKEIFGLEYSGEDSLLLTVSLHAATALGTIVVFRKEVIAILRSLVQARNDERTRMAGMIVLSMIPAVLVGLFLEDAIESLFSGNVLLVGVMLLVTAVLLLFADRVHTQGRDLRWWDAIWVGIAQAIAILPGISRSGATIATSVLLGIERETAARFSFLMVVPLIMGKMAKDLLDGEWADTELGMLPLAAGFMAAFITGILACTWMIQLVKNSRLRYFSLYCGLIGAGAIAWIIFN